MIGKRWTGLGKIAVIGMVGNSAFLSVDRFLQPGEMVAASGIHFEPGGKGFNQAVAAARFGAQVAFLGAVGTEYFDEIRDYLQADGITAVLPRKDAPTAYAVILTDAEGANQVTVYQGVRLSVEDVDDFARYIAHADILLLNNEVPEAVNRRALEIAKEHDTFVIYNPAPSVSLNPEVLDMVDLFTPNEHETAGLEAAKDLIVTLGSKGCYIKSLDMTYPAISVKEVIDTTGAGDTFNGVLAAQLSERAPMEKAVISAICASGVSVTKKYAATAIPTKAEVARFMKEREK